MSRVKPILIALAILAVLSLIVRQVTQAVRHTFSPRSGVALLDRATPAEQNGLTLLEIDNVSSDRNYSYTDKGPQDMGGLSGIVPADTGLWIRLPDGHFLPAQYSFSGDNDSQNPVIVRARTNTGQTFPLHWSGVRGQGKAGLVLAFIPAGYPNTVRWVNVTFDDRIGDTATWRIAHLPPMQHVLAPPVTPQTTFHQGSVTVTARASAGKDPNRNERGTVLLCDIKGKIAPAQHQWELGHLKFVREWEPPNYLPPDSGSTFGANKQGNQITFEIAQQPVYWNQAMPYVSAIHWVRLSAKLQEFETYDETVILHHVTVVKSKNGSQYVAGSGPQTVTTPSGVTVTLDDIQHRQNLTNEWDGGGYSVHLLYPQTMPLPSLPHSPLWRKFKRPVSVNADIPKPYESRGSSYGSGEGTYHFETSRILPKVIPNFPLIIRQRVDLRLVPMTFTLPVLDKAPVKHL